ncbi:8771_t:CDS:2 [Entrophospora sp. SA101]|nr:8771_t:CDS:2 [Entrophospora sp. SA101]
MLEKDCNAPKFFQLRLENPHAFINWCEREYNATLEWKKLESKMIGGDTERKETFKKHKCLQANTTQSSWWIITHNNNSIDVGNEFARTIVWDEIKMLEYDHLVLSFIIDFTQPQKKFQHIISQVFDKVTCIPESYFKTLSQTFENLFNKFYLDNKRWCCDNFGLINNDD